MTILTQRSLIAFTVLGPLQDFLIQANSRLTWFILKLCLSPFQASRYSKMEKADVLEMTVSYLKAMQRKGSSTEGEIPWNIPTNQK